jgi:hypothetical protein
MGSELLIVDMGREAEAGRGVIGDGRVLEKERGITSKNSRAFLVTN